MFRQHSNRDYQRELRQLRDQLAEMARRVESMIADAVKSFLERDRALAKQTVAADHQVNQDELDTDELCLSILALRQPVASDLRFVTFAMKMVTDLERIADLAVSVAFRALDLPRDAEPELDCGKLECGIPELAEAVRDMVHEAIEAFLEGDATLARAVIDRDDDVDEAYHAAYRSVLKGMLESPDRIEEGIRLQRVCKYLERMGDHTTNLAEQVVYMVQGKDIRHPGKRADTEQEEPPTTH